MKYAEPSSQAIPGTPYPYWRYVEPLARTLQREAEGPEPRQEKLSSGESTTFPVRHPALAGSSNPVTCAMIPETETAAQSQSN